MIWPSGWFRGKVGSLAELKGMKMRFLGLGARVMQKLGVSTQLLVPADIYPALCQATSGTDPSYCLTS